MRRWVAVVIVAGAWASSVAVAPVASSAAGCPTPDATHFEVTNNLDALAPPAGSLRAAFAAATGANGGSICIDQSVGTITLVGTLVYSGVGALAIEGNGATVTGNDTFRLVDALTAAVTVSNITFSHGHSTTIDRSGGLSVASATVINSTFSNNSVSTNPNFSIGGAITALPGPIVITGSLFTNNSSALQGGAIFTNPGSITITNSTFDTNPAPQGSITAAGDITLRFVTFVANSLYPGGTLRMYGSVMVQGTPNCLPSGFGPSPVSQGYNYSDDLTCNLIQVTDNEQVGNNPLLDPLANNGGPTATRLPQTLSPLVNAIAPLVAGQCPSEPTPIVTTDQRGLLRPSGTGCEIGAVELQVPAGPVAPVVAPTVRFTG